MRDVYLLPMTNVSILGFSVIAVSQSQKQARLLAAGWVMSRTGNDLYSICLLLVVRKLGGSFWCDLVSAPYLIRTNNDQRTCNSKNLPGISLHFATPIAPV